MPDTMFRVCDTYFEAEMATDEGLIPLAVKLVEVPDLPFTGAPLVDIHQPYALVAMTTVFNDEKANGKLGWYSLQEPTKQNIAELLADNGWHGLWIFLAQTFVEADDA